MSATDEQFSSSNIEDSAVILARAEDLVSILAKHAEELRKELATLREEMRKT